MLACKICDGTYDDWSVNLENWNILNSVLRPLNLCQKCYFNSIPEERWEEVKGSIKVCDVERRFLFILMEFCDGGLESIFGENDSIKLGEIYRGRTYSLACCVLMFSF